MLLVWQKIALTKPANQNLVAIRVLQQTIVASSRKGQAIKLFGLIERHSKIEKATTLFETQTFLFRRQTKFPCCFFYFKKLVRFPKINFKLKTSQINQIQNNVLMLLRLAESKGQCTLNTLSRFYTSFKIR